MSFDAQTRRATDSEDPELAETEDPESAETEDPESAGRKLESAESEPEPAESELESAESEPKSAGRKFESAESELKPAESELESAESEPESAESEPESAESEPESAESETDPEELLDDELEEMVWAEHPHSHEARQSLRRDMRTPGNEVARQLAWDTTCRREDEDDEIRAAERAEVADEQRDEIDTYSRMIADVCTDIVDDRGIACAPFANDMPSDVSDLLDRFDAASAVLEAAELADDIRDLSVAREKMLRALREIMPDAPDDALDDVDDDAIDESIINASVTPRAADTLADTHAADTLADAPGDAENGSQSLRLKRKRDVIEHYKVAAEQLETGLIVDRQAFAHLARAALDNVVGSPMTLSWAAIDTLHVAAEAEIVRRFDRAGSAAVNIGRRDEVQLEDLRHTT